MNFMSPLPFTSRSIFYGLSEICHFYLPEMVSHDVTVPFYPQITTTGAQIQTAEFSLKQKNVKIKQWKFKLKRRDFKFKQKEFKLK